MNHDTRVLLMGVLWAGFIIGRVGGQAYVKQYSPTWLPPFDDWYSGRVSYRTVFLWQLWFSFIMGLMLFDVVSGLGILSPATMKALGTPLVCIAFIYFATMIARYTHTMWKHPSRRWFKKTIPIWFHMLLACYVGLYGGHLQALSL